ncbi:MAG: hypothetical protein AAFX94_07175 [Myxococcota bacterium]
MTLNVAKRFVGAVLAVAALSCADELEGTQPPDNVLYFPIGLEVSADGRYAYVSNSNFDLRFNSGWLATIDLENALGIGTDEPPADVVNPEVGFQVFARDEDGDLILDDGQPQVENTLPVMVGQLRVPSLGGTIAPQGPGRIYIAHRTDRLVSIIDLDGPTASCGDPNATAELSVDERRTDCDRDHLFEIEPEDAEASSTPDDSLTEFDVGDPYSLLVNQPAGRERPYLFAGQLNRARLTAMEVQDDSTPLALGQEGDRIAGRSEALIAVGRFNDLQIVPGTEGRFMAALGFTRPGSQNRAVVVHVDLDLFLDRDDEPQVVLDLGSDVGGQEFASGVFDPTGRWLYAVTRVTNPTFTDNARGAVYRVDATIERFDITNDQGERDVFERPRYQVEGVTALRGQPSGAVYIPRADGDLLVVSDLDEDAVYVLDPLSSELPVLARLDVPGGPFTLRSTEVAGRPLIVAGLFYDHGIALIDATGAPSNFRVTTIVRSDRLGVGERAR